jgi:hypothetical protein
MVDLSEARTLCSKSELNLVESSFAPMLETITPSNLKLKIDDVRKLHQKCTKMISLLHSESRISTTRRKIELFAEAIGRLQAALDNKENSQNAEGPVVKHDIKTTVKEISAPGPDTHSERSARHLESLDRRILSAQRDEQQNPKSRSTRAESHVGSIPRRQQGRRNSSKNH